MSLHLGCFLIISLQEQFVNYLPDFDHINSPCTVHTFIKFFNFHWIIHSPSLFETDCDFVSFRLFVSCCRHLLITSSSAFFWPSDLQMEYALTEDFCRNHFLAGLLLREVSAALQEFREIRQIAIQVLKNLMIKHTFDDRYTSKVCGFFLIFIGCVQDHPDNWLNVLCVHVCLF